MEYNVLQAIKQINQSVKRLQERMAPDSNGQGHGRLLQLIEKNEGISPKELALLLSIRPSTCTEKLNLLERDGHIVRKKDRQDRRSTGIYLTPSGHLALARRVQSDKNMEQLLCDLLTPEEQLAFCAICQRIVAGLSQSEQDDVLHEKNIVSIHEEQKRQNEKQKKCEKEII